MLRCLPVWATALTCHAVVAVNWLQVQRDFEELPAGAALSLRDSLVSLLVKHCQVGRLADRLGVCGSEGST